MTPKERLQQVRKLTTVTTDKLRRNYLRSGHKSAHFKTNTEYFPPKNPKITETEHVEVSSFNARVSLQRTSDMASERDDRKRMQNVCLLVNPSSNRVY